MLNYELICYFLNTERRCLQMDPLFSGINEIKNLLYISTAIYEPFVRVYSNMS